MIASSDWYESDLEYEPGTSGEAAGRLAREATWDRWQANGMHITRLVPFEGDGELDLLAVVEPVDPT